MVAIIGLVALLSLIAMALVLRGLREEVIVLRAMVEGAKQSVVVPARGEIIGLKERLEVLEGTMREEEFTESVPSEKEIQFRNAALRTLAKLLHQHEAGPSEIAELIGDFPEAEREKLVEYLVSEMPEAPSQGAGIAEAELKKAPAPVVELDSIPIQAHGSEPVSEVFSASESGPSIPVKMREHAVQPGETLSGIARYYSVPVPKIMKLNEIDNPDRIRVGRVLEIP
ncbi:MAG: LysM domain-containing protein, partial [Verrucomicrobiota bacterium]|nr:LysM domain-containing protein [Verrucomicrobiota bacterium]